MKSLWIFGFLVFAQPVSTSDHLSIMHDGHKMTTIHRDDFNTHLLDIPILNYPKYHLFLDDLEKQMYKPPINARLDEYARIVSEKPGYRLNRKKFTERFYSYFYEGNRSTVEVPTKTIYPRVDSELLANIRVKLIGQYVTFFKVTNKKRTHNISLSAEAINNQVIFPGERFSFNKVVGKRTVDKGYQRAPIIVKGELSEGIGGGICQVSSTLFNAVDNAGVKIVERYSHSRSVPYVPPGRDATVSWYGPDFCFINHYNQPILIRATVHGSRVVVQIFSSDDIRHIPRNLPTLLPNKRT
ncbi:VanW family protein [Metabacillus arenae]|uniref:VanW family protein n=1 Tax=Metabacillus arenae TaxID=2771434 RepID=A0A926RZ03_9BACI|nr:VanW family protein [Metabacillus arenae]MBD1381722.1 VanW family protein [Metabacillus arenae]